MILPEQKKALTEKILDAYTRLGAASAAAREVGIPERTARKWLTSARDNHGVVTPDDPNEQWDEVNDLPEYSSVRDRIKSHNETYINHFNDRRSVTLQAKHSPILLFFIGDLHLDSPGFDIHRFDHDMEIISRAKHEFGGNCKTIFMGDLLDNWPLGGRLGKKHHDGHITRKEGLALAKGFLENERPDLDVLLLGNHDHWPGKEYEVLIRQWCNAPVIDWAGYINLVTDQGWTYYTFAAHDMSGHSMYNQIHGLARRAREDGTADLHVAAHRHHTGSAQEYNGHRNQTYNHLRVGSYKRADEYAHHKGFPDSSDEGATGLAVIYPDSKTQDGRCCTFYDLELGVDYGRMLKCRGS